MGDKLTVATQKILNTIAANFDDAFEDRIDKIPIVRNSD